MQHYKDSLRDASSPLTLYNIHYSTLLYVSVLTSLQFIYLLVFNT